MDVRGKTIRGTFFHAPRCGEFETLGDALVTVGGDGRIADVVRADDPRHGALCRDAAASHTLIEIANGSYVLPGLVDLHIHAPQYPQLGVALDAPLEVWLHKYTFPLEARYADLDFARQSYSALIDDLAANGTTTALMFATVHQEATRLLADLAIAKGLRALVGKVVMDDPWACPDYYRDASAETAIAETRSLIEYVRTHPENMDGRVKPVITPRFIPSCTDAALKGLGDLARETGCHVQTHCSESDWEHGYVLARHGCTDAASLDSFGLLTRRTVLAHSNFISGDDMDLLHERGSGVAHCPLSNAYFSNAVFPLRAALEKRVHVGLGTDISGGPSASLFDNMRMCVASSRMLEDGVDPDMAAANRHKPGSRVDWQTAFHLATAGGAAALDIETGTFAPGRHFDAIVVDTATRAGTIRLMGDDLPHEDILARIVYTASKPNIVNTIVGGRGISSAN
ncbi:guanine deaminase [Aestuariivirga sp.]|uniref:guanine deaminase n=1 Tax=Aestuariivirga sp. TaxID=2650926 RepID=UPI0035935096